MDSLEDINKKLNSSYNVKKIVTTMKALSVTNIKIYEKTFDSLYQYKANVELGMQAILSKYPEIIGRFQNKSEKNKKTKDIIIVYGSNQGLCGKFNDKILDFFTEDLKERGAKSSYTDNFLIVVGNKLKVLFENKRFIPDASLAMPNSMEDNINIVHNLLNYIDGFKENFNIRKVLLYYINYSESNDNLIKKQLLPIGMDLLQDMSKKVWPTRVIPFWKIDTKDLLLDFIKQFVFINLYYSLVVSLISEQKYRLRSLQNSEKNVSDLIRDMKLEYNQKKQNLVTSEMLDIISGYNMLKD